ncbi:MAG: glutathione S-transferase family protein [Pseudomonadota bacterium]
MLTLYLSPGSSSMAVHIALHEIGVPFEARPLSFARQEQRTPEFLALNPEGKVPTLVVDGRPLTEVAGILFYLAKRFPGAALLPGDDIETEARAVSWMSFIAATLHPARKRGLEHATQVYGIADHRLGARDWVLGRYSIVDIHLFRLYWRLFNSLKPSRETFPHLTAHLDRMLQRAAVKQTLEAEAAIGFDLPP